ncbi:hypothetical protein [Pseudonocardia ailaonensis]|uniref:hypothetical protein n=1 Tax=Pseudonocardia ailaonensis TaxID=367279 RepID=UPI0031D8CABD
MTGLQQALWDERTEGSGVRYVVPLCPFEAVELAELAARGERLGYLPPDLATQQGRHGLANLFPGMASYALHIDNVVTNDDNPAGWFSYEADIDCPFGDTTEAELMTQVAAADRVLLTLNQYVVASQDSRRLTGHYLDERGFWVRTGSRVDGRVATARFDGSAEAPGGAAYRDPVEGSLLVGYDLGAGDHGPTHGARTATRRHRVLVENAPLSRTALAPFSLARLTDLDPEAERQRLVALLVARGYPAALGMSAEEYVRGLPTFAARPQSYRGRLDVPLLVETRIPWTRQADLCGIRFVPRAGDYAPVDERSRMPATPYSGWFSLWGGRFPDPISPADARAGLAEDEVGANLCELVAMTAAHPGISGSGRFLDAIGYQLPYLEDKPDITYAQSLRTPGMYHWRGAPEVGANIHPRAFSIFRPLVRGTAVTHVARAAP